MQKHLPVTEKDPTCKVSRFALQTLGVLARDHSSELTGRDPLESYLQQMQSAVLIQQRNVLDDLVAQMRRALIPPAEIAETYVPIVARRLGACWVEDTLDFRLVSIGSARLQSLLWKLESEIDARMFAGAVGQTQILIGVPDGCQHTLGATVLTGQLRRMGYGVQFELELTPARLATVMGQQNFAGVLISASTRENLEILTELVQTARQSRAATPVFIGGNVLDQMADVKDITGADLATSDVDVVLEACGLDRRATSAALQDAG